MLRNLDENQQEFAEVAKRIKLQQLFAKNPDIKREFVDLKNALL